MRLIPPSILPVPHLLLSPTFLFQIHVISLLAPTTISLTLILNFLLKLNRFLFQWTYTFVHEIDQLLVLPLGPRRLVPDVCFHSVLLILYVCFRVLVLKSPLLELEGQML